MEAVDTTAEFQSAAPVVLFTGSSPAFLGATGRQYDVAKNGRFLVNALQQQSSSFQLTVVVNWLSAVQR